MSLFTLYVALNPVPNCNAYYAYTTLYEHWRAKFGLPEILVTENGTEFIKNEIITLCHLYNIKHQPRTSNARWTNGLVECMNRSLQEYIRCILMEMIHDTLNGQQMLSYFPYHKIHKLQQH